MYEIKIFTYPTSRELCKYPNNSLIIIFFKQNKVFKRIINWNQVYVVLVFRLYVYMLSYDVIKELNFKIDLKSGKKGQLTVFDIVSPRNVIRCYLKCIYQSNKRMYVISSRGLNENVVY